MPFWVGGFGDQPPPGLELVPLAYDALGAPSPHAQSFLAQIVALLPPQRQSSFQATASLLLSVALAKNTAAILLDRTEAALHGDYGYTKLSDAAWADQSLADWTSAECGAWARDPVANELAYV